MRLRSIAPEYQVRLTLRIRPFPLEVRDGEGLPRGILEQEWWLAAIQEPAATFAPYPSDDWPTTTLPAVEAAWCAGRQVDDARFDYDLRVRRAFFGEERNIGRRDVWLAIAEETDLDLARCARDLVSGQALRAAREEARLGREQYRVRGTPTLMLADGTRQRHPIACPKLRDRKVVGVDPLPCRGEECWTAPRSLLEGALPFDPLRQSRALS